MQMMQYTRHTYDFFLAGVLLECDDQDCLFGQKICHNYRNCNFCFQGVHHYYVGLDNLSVKIAELARESGHFSVYTMGEKGVSNSIFLDFSSRNYIFGSFLCKNTLSTH